jgi:LPS O-antigen subunit length determinant protein (WzzB/FepE family)
MRRPVALLVGALPAQRGSPRPQRHSLQVLFLSFSTIIGIMIGTFFVVVNTGAVRLAGLD